MNISEYIINYLPSVSSFVAAIVLVKKVASFLSIFSAKKEESESDFAKRNAILTDKIKSVYEETKKLNDNCQAVRELLKATDENTETVNANYKKILDMQNKMNNLTETVNALNAYVRSK